MDAANCYLYSKFIEETVRGGSDHYRSAGYASSLWAQHPDELDRPKSYRLLCIKFAWLPVVRIRLPRWVSVSTLSL